MILQFFRWAKKEILHVLPAFIFFFIAFNILNWTEHYLFKRAGITPYSFLEIIAAAAVIAKVLLVIDHLPFINLFPKKPLIFNIVWKAFFYWIINFCVRFAIHLSPFIFNNKSIVFELTRFFTQMNWDLFITVQVWYLILFFIFVTFHKLSQKIGPAKMRKMFFGR